MGNPAGADKGLGRGRRRPSVRWATGPRVALVLLPAAFAVLANLGGMRPAWTATAIYMASGWVAAVLLPRDFGLSSAGWMIAGTLLVGFPFKMVGASPSSFAALEIPLSEQDIYAAYEFSALLYAASVVSAALAARVLGQNSVPKVRTNARISLLWIAAAFGGLTAVQVALGYGVLGLPARSLPPGVGPLLLISRQLVLPGLAALEGLQDRGRRRIVAFSLIVVFALADAVVTTSRGALLRAALLLLLVLLLSGQRELRRLALRSGALVVLVGIAAFPMVSSLRVGRITTDSANLDLTSAIASAPASSVLILDRIQGIEGLATASTYGASRAVVSATDILRGRANGVYTRDVVGVESESDFRTPGLFGLLRLAGSAPWDVLMAAGTAVALVVSSRLATRTRTGIVSQAIILAMIPGLYSDGTVPALVLAGVAAAILNVIVKAIERRGSFSEA